MIDRATALVTGGTGGIGFHVAAALARAGSRVIVTGRDPGRGDEAVARLRHAAGHDGISLVLSDASSIRENIRLAGDVAGRFGRLDVLVNNAGRVFPNRVETSEGLEATLALNFAGPFALTTHLLPLLTKGGRSRIVNVASSAFHMWTRDPFEDLQSREGYVGLQAHARAKLLNLLFTLALARRVSTRGVVVNAINPGMAWTPGVAALTPEAVPQWRWIWPLVRWVQRRASAAKAARGPVLLATTLDASLSGQYFDGTRPKPLPAHVLDAALQERAWNLGESLVAEVCDPRTRRPVMIG